MILPNSAKVNKITKKLFYFALRQYYQYYFKAFHPHLAYYENITAQLQNGVVSAMLFVRLYLYYMSHYYGSYIHKYNFSGLVEDLTVRNVVT